MFANCDIDIHWYSQDSENGPIILALVYLLATGTFTFDESIYYKDAIINPHLFECGVNGFSSEYYEYQCILMLQLENSTKVEQHGHQHSLNNTGSIKGKGRSSQLLFILYLVAV